MDLKELFERQHRRVYRLALLYLKNAADAEDAVQNVFLKYAERPRDFESESHETAWFITVTRNYLKDQFKSFWRRSVDLGDLPMRTEPKTEDGRVLEAVLALPAKYREVLYLYYYEAYPVKEIAAMLSRKESTVQTQLFDGRRKLKEILEKEECRDGR